MEMLTQYRNVREILNFLKTSDPTTEKEIYMVAGESSLLWDLRPPFFQLFDLRESEFDKLVPQVRIEDWSYAMLNVNRQERKEIEKRFSEKQRFRYFEMLRSLDSNPPPKTSVGDVREKIAQMIVKVKNELSKETPPSVEAENYQPEEKQAA